MKLHPFTTQRRMKRSAVTVLEVLFATMVVVVGLIGIATVLPYAARNAQEATAHTHALNLGLGWADSFFARGLHRSLPNVSQGQLSWLWYRDYVADNTAGQGWENFVREGYSNDASTDFGRFRVNSTFPLQFQFESRSFSIDQGDHSRRIWGHLPVCIDPYFMTSSEMIARANAGRTRVGSYRAAVFPCFNDRYDPVVDPFLEISSAATHKLPVDQPRMLRVTLAYGQQSGNPPYRRGVPVSRPMIADLFGSMDHLQIDDSVDMDLSAVDRNSRPASRFFAKSNDQALKPLTDGRFTWLATVVPAEPQKFEVSDSASSLNYARRPQNSCLVSFVVLNRHSHNYVPFDPNLPEPLPGDQERQPTGERIARVYPLSGSFQGGTGGRVRLVASASVSSKINVGDWVVLGRYFLLDASMGPPTNQPRPYPLFRWYRVIGTSEDAAYGPLSEFRVQNSGFSVENDPPGNTDVWARDIVLEGPDFPFGALAGTSGHPPTFATIVSGVVTVIERQVNLE